MTGRLAAGAALGLAPTGLGADARLPRLQPVRLLRDGRVGLLRRRCPRNSPVRACERVRRSPSAATGRRPPRLASRSLGRSRGTDHARGHADSAARAAPGLALVHARPRHDVGSTRLLRLPRSRCCQTSADRCPRSYAGSAWSAIDVRARRGPRFLAQPGVTPRGLSGVSQAGWIMPRRRGPAVQLPRPPRLPPSQARTSLLTEGARRTAGRSGRCPRRGASPPSIGGLDPRVWVYGG